MDSDTLRPGPVTHVSDFAVDSMPGVPYTGIPQGASRGRAARMDRTNSRITRRDPLVTTPFERVTKFGPADKLGAGLE